MADSFHLQQLHHSFRHLHVLHLQCLMVRQALIQISPHPHSARPTLTLSFNIDCCSAKLCGSNILSPSLLTSYGPAGGTSSSISSAIRHGALDEKHGSRYVTTLPPPQSRMKETMEDRSRITGRSPIPQQQAESKVSTQPPSNATHPCCNFNQGKCTVAEYPYVFRLTPPLSVASLLTLTMIFGGHCQYICTVDFLAFETFSSGSHVGIRDLWKTSTSHVTHI